MRFTSAQLPGALGALCAVVVLCAPVFEARADCKTSGIVLFPRPGSVVPTNAELVLEGRGGEVPRVKDLIGQTLYLKSGEGETVALDVKKGWTSERERIAVRLVPKAALKPNSKYTLILDGVMPGYENLDERAARTPFWRSGAGPDKERPKWTKLPAPAEGKYVVDGGRVIREVRFNVSLVEESPTYVIVTLKRARGTTSAQVYFAPIDGSSFVLGEDGCSGNFVFEDGRAYFAQVEGFDAAGNRAPPTRRIELHAPRQNAP